MVLRSPGSVPAAPIESQLNQRGAGVTASPASAQSLWLKTYRLKEFQALVNTCAWSSGDERGCWFGETSVTRLNGNSWVWTDLGLSAVLAPTKKQENAFTHQPKAGRLWSRRSRTRFAARDLPGWQPVIVFLDIQDPSQDTLIWMDVLCHLITSMSKHEVLYRKEVGHVRPHLWPTPTGSPAKTSLFRP